MTSDAVGLSWEICHDLISVSDKRQRKRLGLDQNYYINPQGLTHGEVKIQ
jgi:hypothetical protein